MVTVGDLTPKEQPQWCPGCGNYGILVAMKSALVKLGIPTHRTVVVSGIGCSGKTPHYLRTYGFEGLHGRILPVATGIKLANHDLTVIGMGGDGDGYGIGLNHVMHAARRNIDITYVVHDNRIYGLTTGQASPTTIKGTRTKSTPFGVIEEPVNPLALALASEGTFVARAYAGDIPRMTEIFVEAIKHKGFALVDVLQPCPSFNKVNTREWYQERVYDLQKEGHDVSDKDAAYKKTWEDVETNYERIPVGIFYKEERPTYRDEIPHLKGATLLDLSRGSVDISKSLKAHA